MNKWLRRSEVARQLGVSVTTVDTMVADGRLPRPRKVGRYQQSPVLFDARETKKAVDVLMADALIVESGR